MTPRYYQQEAANSVFEYFENNSGNPVIVMPTGTGKSFVIALNIYMIFSYYPNQRVMMLTHDKRLIEQNAATLVKLWPAAPVGIFSAGLNQKQFSFPIIYAGIASVVKNPEIFGHRDIVFVDECDLISPKEETMYQKVLYVLKEINPNIKIVGLTATPYRQKQGMITEGGLFTDICYDLSEVNKFNRLVSEGYLSPLVAPSTLKSEFDISSVKIRMGDYDEKSLAKATDDSDIRFAALQEAAFHGQDRNCWMVFENSIDHAEEAAEMLNYLGISAAAVHSKKKDSDKLIEAFKAGEIKAIVNKDMLTVGFDHPPIDMGADLAHTISTRKHVQKMGRMVRTYDPNNPGRVNPNAFPYFKHNALWLDFAKNVDKLGPINAPTLPRKPGQRGTGEIPVRICDECGLYNRAAARYCGEKPRNHPEFNPSAGCGHEFIFEVKFSEIVSTKSPMKLNVEQEKPIVDLVNVKSVIYNLHSKSGKPDSIKVSYLCGLQTFSEWVCLEHDGFAGKKAREWWRERHSEEPPATTAEALERTSKLTIPKQIKVWLNKKPNAEIMGYIYG
jgi:DNA repair protein RadD